jgi:hypothetical protein
MIMMFGKLTLLLGCSFDFQLNECFSFQFCDVAEMTI